MDGIKRTVALTGYRTDKMPFAEDSQDANYCSFRKKLLVIISRLMEMGYDSYISGMAMGFDTWAAESVIELGASLECAVPFPEQVDGWEAQDQQRWVDIINKSSKKTVVSESNQKGAYYKRNRYMVDNADVILCGYTGRKRGGTAYTVNYALQQDKIVIQLHPKTLEITILSERKIDL